MSYDRNNITAIPLPSTLAPAERKTHQRVLRAGRSYQESMVSLTRDLPMVEEGRWYRSVGCATLAEYGEMTCGLSPRDTRELARAGRELRKLPALSTAFEDRDLGWSKVRELSRVATETTEQGWIEYGQEHTCRQVEQAVASAERGDEAPAPNAPARPSKTVRLTFPPGARPLAQVRSGPKPPTGSGRRWPRWGWCSSRTRRRARRSWWTTMRAWTRWLGWCASAWKVRRRLRRRRPSAWSSPSAPPARR